MADNTLEQWAQEARGIAAAFFNGEVSQPARVDDPEEDGSWWLEITCQQIIKCSLSECATAYDATVDRFVEKIPRSAREHIRYSVVVI